MNNLAIADISSATLQSDLRLDSADTVKEFLDAQFPLSTRSHRDVAQYYVYYNSLVAHLKTGQCVGLANPGQFADYGGEKNCPTFIVFSNAEQQIELQL